jgi:hypoxanthine phosphoribosyltransferase
VLGDIERILIDRQRIAQRIREMGERIRQDYAGMEAGAEIVLVPVLTGSIIFVAYLMRELPNKVRISVIGASSYPGKATASQGVTLAGSAGSGELGGDLVGGLSHDLSGRHVLIVDDILDSGRTIRTIRDEISRRNPKSVRACVLLRKTIPSALATPCEYVGFDIPDEFVVGYGLDYDNYYRNLPDIGTLKKEAMG